MICSSTDTYSSISIEAIEAGKRVFCKKPIDHDVDKIKAVMKVQEGKATKYQVGFNRRFDYNFRALQQPVKAGKIGDSYIISVSQAGKGGAPCLGALPFSLHFCCSSFCFCVY